MSPITAFIEFLSKLVESNSRVFMVWYAIGILAFTLGFLPLVEDKVGWAIGGLALGVITGGVLFIVGMIANMH